MVKGNLILPHMQGVLREEEDQKHHYCSKSSDEGLNTTFYPNTPDTQKYMLYLTHWHTSKGKHAWKSAFAYAVKTTLVHTFSSNLQRRGRDEPHSIFVRELPGWVVGQNPEEIKFLRAPRVTVQNLETKISSSSNKFRILCKSKTETALFVGTFIYPFLVDFCQ